MKKVTKNQPRISNLSKSSLHIGTGDFMDLVSGDVFVDKTLLIKDILTDGDLKALLITRPRRWGKTLNMSMLYNFLRCEVTQNETTRELETVNPHPGLFDNLNIGKEYPELTASHQGRWPVISLNLKGVVGGDIQTVEQKFRDIFAELYKKHMYLMDWLSSPEKKGNFIAEAEYFSDVRRGKANLAMLQKSLYSLSELLREYHGQRVFVLLDEYDAPLNNTFLKPALYEQVLIFMRGLLGDCFKDNLYLEKGIMTGILRIAKADLFSGINNFKEYSLLDKRYAEYFGFTSAEVNNLFEQPYVKELIEAHAPDPEDIKVWYNGYTIGGVTIYNPWSIMSCISEGGTLAPYWVTTGSDTLLRNLLKDSGDLVQQVEQLLTEDAIEVKISPYINMLDMDHNLKFWSLMLAAGYVTLAEEIPKQSSIKRFCKVRIPNMEIRATYEDLIMGWFEDQVGPSYYIDMMKSLFRGESELFSQILNRYLTEATSLRNVGLSGAEKFYSGFMGGLFISMQKDFAINSEVESGQGYTDMLVIPRAERSRTAVIFEYKIAKNQGALAGKVQEALDQIDDKKYITRVQFYPHIEKIVKVGVAFCGKEAIVETRNIELR
ncbi:MAG: AAA family ATPase [Bacteroidota bacterium]